LPAQYAPGPRSFSGAVLLERRAFVMRCLFIPYAVASGAAELGEKIDVYINPLHNNNKKRSLLESIRHRISLVLLELPITGMCLPTHGSSLRDGN
jgi:hypothetical protein